MDRKEQQVFWRDSLDPDFFHFGYRYPMQQLPGRFIHRLTASFHVDDIPEMFGEEVYARAVDLARGEMDFLWIKAELAEEAA